MCFLYASVTDDVIVLCFIEIYRICPESVRLRPPSTGSTGETNQQIRKTHPLPVSMCNQMDHETFKDHGFRSLSSVTLRCDSISISPRWTLDMSNQVEERDP